MRTNMTRLMSESGTLLIDETEDVMVIITADTTSLFHLGSMTTDDISELQAYLSNLQTRKMPPPPPQQVPVQWQQPPPQYAPAPQPVPQPPVTPEEIARFQAAAAAQHIAPPQPNQVDLPPGYELPEEKRSIIEDVKKTLGIKKKAKKK